MKTIRLLLSVAFASLCFTSCATFPKNRLPKLSESGTGKGKKVALTYSLSAGHRILKNRAEAGELQKESARKALVAAAEKSGRFSSVKEGTGGAVHVNADLLNHGNGPAAFVSGFISGFTFTAIPAVASDNYTLTADVRTSSGKSRNYVLDDGVTTVIWLPMIFAMPSHNPAKVTPEVHENLFGNLISQMEKDGLLPRN